MADEDARKSEIDMLAAMYPGDGEFQGDVDGDPFSFILRLRPEGFEEAVLELKVDLPEGYPAVNPSLRLDSAANISRTGMDELTAGMNTVVQDSEGEPCMPQVADWLTQNAAPLIQPKSEEVEVPAPRAEKHEKNVQRGTQCKMFEVHGDVFEAGPEWSLCHCVSKDLDMSAGIAVLFKKEFGGVEVLRGQNVDVGGVASLLKKGRYVYYLVTKNKHGGKPTLETLEASLIAMRERIKQDGVKQLAMPKIACGLDRLCWGTVQSLVLQVFDDVPIEIQVRFK